MILDDLAQRNAAIKKMASHLTLELINVARHLAARKNGLRASAKLAVPLVSAWPKHFATEVTGRGVSHQVDRSEFSKLTLVFR
jgi:hypothetical protein